MNLPLFALKNKTIVVVIAVLLTLQGVNVFLTAPRKEDPQFVIRDAWVITVWPGATAEQVERLVADPIEEALVSVEAIRKIDTTSYVGYCVNPQASRRPRGRPARARRGSKPLRIGAASAGAEGRIG